MKNLQHKFRLWRSVRFRLTLWYVAIVAVVLLVFASQMYVAQVDSLESGLQASLSDHADQLAATYDSRDGQLHWQDQTVGQNVSLDVDEIALLMNSQEE